MSKNYMYHFKHQDCGISFIGWNDDKRVYSQDYYANIGICNCEERKHISYKQVKKLTNNCIKLGYKKVSYLPKEKSDE